MKVEVGKFYKNRIGEKVEAVCYGLSGSTVLLSNDHYVFADTGNANYEGNGPCDADLIEEWKEPAKPEITVGSRWTNIGKESKTVTVVHINDKYVTFEHDGRATIETTTHDTFYAAYKPYVEPPKSLVGYVGVIDSGCYLSFTLICKSEEEVLSLYSVKNYNIVAVKKIEWTEGE